MVAGAANPVVIDITRFAGLKYAGDAYRAGFSVDLRLEDADTNLLRRAIDFASGMVFATDGTMTKLADRRFLLTPAPPRADLEPPPDGAGDREPRRPSPIAGAGAAAVPMPDLDDFAAFTLGAPLV